MVRTRDGHCRFPGCSVPAARCQLDHVVPFAHRNPVAGGWTIVSNLQCLCRFHHNLKTMGRFGAAVLDGGVVVWASPFGTSSVTLPGGAFAGDTAEGLIPYLPRGPRGREVPQCQPDGLGPPPF